MTKKSDSKEVAAKTEVAVPPAPRLIGQPGVVAIGGVIQEPIAKVRKINGELVHNNILLVDYDFTSVGDRSEMLSIYSYSVKVGGEADRIDLFIVADELSSLDIEPPRYLDFQEDGFTVLTLLNSRSKNDYFRGSVVLVNVETESNDFENSVIEVNHRYYPRGLREHKLQPETARATLTEVYTRGLRFQGRSLPRGSYIDSEVRESTFIRGEKDDHKQVRIVDSNIRWCNFREGDIDIKGVDANQSDFLFVGDVFLRNVTVNSERFGDKVPGLYLASPFDLTSINVAGKEPAKMIRVSEDKVLITLPRAHEAIRWDDSNVELITMSFRNPERRGVLRSKTREMLFGDDMQSDMEDSVLQYFIDTVMSRCSMINLVDSANRLLKGNLIGAKEPTRINQWNVLSPGRMSETGAVTRGFYTEDEQRAIDNGNTIFIDKVGKF